MKNNTMTRMTPFALGVAAMLATAGGVSAQSTSVDEGGVEIVDTDGDSAVLIDNGADYTAGGNGRTASLNLRGSDGPTTLSYNAFQAQLILGGGIHEGILLLKDDDGVTTTIDLDGRTGLVDLGGLGEDGDLTVRDGSDAVTIRLNGATGTVTNSSDGNGLAKAWAKINSDGSVVDCFRCDSSQNTLEAAGVFVVDFGIDVLSRPKVATLEQHSGNFATRGVISVGQQSTTGDPSRVLVVTNLHDHTLPNVSLPFTLVIY